jgi:hypothetical protein
MLSILDHFQWPHQAAPTGHPKIRVAHRTTHVGTICYCLPFETDFGRKMDSSTTAYAERRYNQHVAVHSKSEMKQSGYAIYGVYHHVYHLACGPR